VVADIGEHSPVHNAQVRFLRRIITSRVTQLRLSIKSSPCN
jgi:hypothetical protein